MISKMKAGDLSKIKFSAFFYEYLQISTNLFLIILYNKVKYKRGKLW